VRLASNTGVADALGGFRAMHREAAPRLCVFSNYTYTLETIIQPGRKNLAIASVPSESTVSSDLTAGQEHSVGRATLDPDDPQDLHPLQAAAVFSCVGVLFLLPGIALGARFVSQCPLGRGTGHVQSLILAAILIVISVVVFAAGKSVRLYGGEPSLARRNSLGNCRPASMHPSSAARAQPWSQTRSRPNNLRVAISLRDP
jgi:hypothetical protein